MPPQGRVIADEPPNDIRPWKNKNLNPKHYINNNAVPPSWKHMSVEMRRNLSNRNETNEKVENSVSLMKFPHFYQHKRITHRKGKSPLTRIYDARSLLKMLLIGQFFYPNNRGRLSDQDIENLWRIIYGGPRTNIPPKHRSIEARTVTRMSRPVFSRRKRSRRNTGN